LGYIAEPKGVDFIIKSEPLTEVERKAISEYIRKYKEKNKDLFIRRKIRDRKKETNKSFHKS
jgi:hypothetical protein